MASCRNGTLYTGVTGDLQLRAYQHRQGSSEGFTKRYGVNLLVHVEEFDDINMGLAREKAIKEWRRAWKLALIERDNPEWRDYFGDLI